MISSLMSIYYPYNLLFRAHIPPGTKVKPLDYAGNGSCDFSVPVLTILSVLRTLLYTYKRVTHTAIKLYANKCESVNQFLNPGIRFRYSAGRHNNRQSIYYGMAHKICTIFVRLNFMKY